MPAPVMRPVFSSHVDSIGYDAEAGELHVTFQATRTQPSRTAVYQGVPNDVAHGILTAPSIGTALHFAVRGQFPFGYKVQK